MVTDKPVIGPIAAYDPETGECVLSNDYKRVIKAALPRGVEPTDSFWRDLADIVSKFRIMQKCRAARRSPAVEVKRWERIAKLATEVIQNTASAQVKILVKGQLKAFRAFQGDFNRKYNRNNEALFFWVLDDLWCRRLGQGLGVSSVGKDVPGPLIRFFAACVNPLLTKPLTADAIVTIRDRVRDRRERYRKTPEKYEARKRTKP